MPWRTVRMGGGRGKLPWYLAGGIQKINCIAAYQPKGADSYVASKVNLVNPGMYDLVNGAAFPTWAVATGWSFLASSSQYLTLASAISSVVPLSMVCRFNSNSAASLFCLMSICNNAAAERFALYANGTVVGDLIEAYTISVAAGFPFATTTTGFTTGNWFTACGTYAAINNRVAYIDGDSVGMEATAATPLGINTTFIGCAHTGVARVHYFDGKISACAFYNIALSDIQVLAVHNAMVGL